MTNRVYNWIRSHKDQISVNRIKLYDGLNIFNVSDVVFYRDYADITYESYSLSKQVCIRVHFRNIQDISYTMN